jgi:hypothetical protein
LRLDMFGRLSLYGTLSADTQEKLLQAAAYNDLRLVTDDPDLRNQQAVSLVRRARDLSGPGGRLEAKIPLTRDDWRSQVTAASEQLLTTPGFKPWERGAALNYWLAAQGACPLVHFAFERWFDIGSYGRELPPEIADDLADLSTTFLYRLVPDTPVRAEGRLIGAGAYSHVYLGDDGTALKVPRNLAGRAFAAAEEHAASLRAADSGLAPFIPVHLGFDEDSGVIRREFIPGTMGPDLLARREFREAPFELGQLERLYVTACEIYRADGLNFDIHPGNIKWDDGNGRWVLVDLGPMPVIGADYFPRDSFARYFRKIWLDRRRLMETVPVRSLDIGIPDPLAAIESPTVPGARAEAGEQWTTRT